MPSACTIREACVDDLPTLFALLRTLHDDDPWAPDDNALAQATLDEIVASPSRAILLASTDDVTAGTLDVTVVPNLSRGVRPWAIVENLVVLEPFRRRGIARELMRAAVRFAEDRGCYKVQLVSAQTRTEAHAFYGACGFDAAVSGYRRYLDR